MWHEAAMAKVTQYDQADWKVFNAANDILDLRIWTVRWPAEAGNVYCGHYFIVRHQVLLCVRLMFAMHTFSAVLRVLNSCRVFTCAHAYFKLGAALT